MIIGQSGGPTAVINASLSGAIQQAMRSPEIGEIYGALNGLEGLLKEHIVDLKASFKTSEDFQLLESTPAAALGSCRFKMPPYPNPAYDSLLKIFRKFDIGYFFYIGGNDSMDTVQKLSEFFLSQGEDVKCVGIPKTVDNDLPITDHTPGFGSAAKYIATSVAEVYCDSLAYDLPLVNIIEVMGRNAGWLTAASVLARRPGFPAPHMILLPEVAFDPDAFFDRAVQLLQTERNLVIAVSEGIRLSDGEYVASTGANATDSFGHAMLSGAGNYIKAQLQSRMPCKVRAIELSLLQRCAAHCASLTDIHEAVTIGAAAVSCAAAGKTGGMMVFHRVSSQPYLVTCDWAPVGDVANLEKTIPGSWITSDGWDVTSDMVEYLRPLIQGCNSAKTVDGMPVYFALDKTLVKK